MRCSSCDFESPPGMRFCGGCGASLAVACSSCGAEIPGEFRFCGQCGTPRPGVSSVMPTAPVAVPQTRQAERRQISVMFCDLVDSTALSSRLDAEELRDVIREYQRVAVEVIERFQGHVAQYLGDGLMVYFGFPTVREDDARRAVLAGLDILDAIERYNAGLSESGGEPIAVRIGLHTGDVVVGEVGHGQQLEQLALGATPNIAARVQSKAEPGSLLISSAMRPLVAGVVALEPAGRHNLKGMQSELELWQALPLLDETSTSAGPLTPFVGRVSELRTLDQQLAAGCEGHGRIVLIEGEAGIGKSRFVSRIQEGFTGDATWLVCRCYSMYGSRPLYPIRSLLQSLLGIEASREEIEAELRSWRVDDPAPAAEVLAAIMRYGDGTSIGALTLPRATAILCDVMVAVSRIRPVVMLLEDVHWIDPSTRDVIEHLSERIKDLPVVIVATARTGEGVELRTGCPSTRLQLRRFSRQETEQLIEGTAARSLPAEVKGQLISRCDGIPLFIEEVARMESGATAGDGSAGTQSIPLTLRDLLAARLDRLAGEVRSTAQMAALFGRRFSVDLLHEVLPDDRDPGAHVNAMERAGIVSRVQLEDGREEYEFRHALLQDVAYETTLRKERQRLHQLVVAGVEAGRITLAPDRLASHLRGAGRATEAVEQFRLAAQQAAALSAYREAIELFRVALAALEESPPGEPRDRMEANILLERIMPLTALGTYWDQEIRAGYQRLLELEDYVDVVRRGQILFSHWSVCVVNGDGEGANQVVQRIRANGLEADYLHTRGVTDFFSGRFDSAIENMRACAEQVDPRKYQPSLFWNLCWALAIAGRAEEAVAVYQDLEQLAEDLKQPFVSMMARMHLVGAYQEWGDDPVRAEALVRGIQELGDRFEMTGWKWSMSLFGGWARALQGVSDGARELQESFQNGYTPTHIIAGQARNVVVEGLLALNHLESAATLLDANDVFYATNMGQFSRANSLRLRGRLLARTANAEAAREQFRAAAALAREQGARLYEYRALHDAAALPGAGPTEQLELRKRWALLPQLHQVAALNPEQDSSLSA